ncbi:MAG: SMP-30/gluconolactonase/LRE family protein, partial [Verrucomicrobia bacterium]|nr:SMP-30/gluconolactonase/LRE family protein [Verrucomicrobiota bacterium]
VGIFIKPGVVPAANDKALPRFNRSYEYDSITPTYSQFLLDEFLPAIEKKHGIQLSTDPNHAAISGNSSGGICAFMVAWHRPDRFRRVFTGVGTYVGIHGADQLPVLVRKFEPKPLRVFLQSGTSDNNLYCGDWWMANQMMERSLSWAGYDVNHAWGEGGHNAKHASQIFPDVLRWLWRDWQTNIEIKANAKGESKWKGYEVVGEGKWEKVYERSRSPYPKDRIVTAEDEPVEELRKITSDSQGVVYAHGREPVIVRIRDHAERIKVEQLYFQLVPVSGKAMLWSFDEKERQFLTPVEPGIGPLLLNPARPCFALAVSHGGRVYASEHRSLCTFPLKEGKLQDGTYIRVPGSSWPPEAHSLCLSPDQTQLYMGAGPVVFVVSIDADGSAGNAEPFYHLDGGTADGLCVDTNGWLYVATELGIQVCDQAGRVNFIIPTPKPPLDVCFGGKDLSELFIACGDAIYKRSTKAHGIVSGQMAPIKPPLPKL